jgi:tetraacyldisaccharide 4'-kinase
MGVFEPDWSQIHQKESLGLWSPFLAFFSIPYGVGCWFRLWAYTKGVFKRRSLPGFVMSIGNLTTGGTGKTPAVAMLARWAREEGYHVAILSKGYGGRYKGKVLEVSDGSRINTNPQETGDEPYLLAKKLSGIPVIISRKRFLAGLFAHEKFGCDFFILDDGFQHLKLKRDLDLVLIDAANPFGNGHLLPWGPLREPFHQLARADASILTRVSSYSSGDKTLDFFKCKFPTIPIFYADHLPSSVVFPHKNEVYNPEFLKGKRTLAFAGIAQPDVFKNTLIGLGADVVYFRGFRDHYQFKRDEIQVLIQMKEKLGAQYLLTTEKDWMRIASYAPVYPDMAYLCVEFALLSDQDAFFKIVKDSINKKTKDGLKYAESV